MTAEQFRFQHSTEWGKDLEVMRRNGPTRWTGDQLDELMKQLSAHGLGIVADAIGSLRFDLVDAAHVREAAQHNEANLREAVRRKQVKDSIIRELRRKLAELEKALQEIADRDPISGSCGDSPNDCKSGRDGTGCIGCVARRALASLRAESKEG